MNITHKILVSKETGKIIPPVYPINDERPCPLDAEWIELFPGTAPYKLFVSNEDVSHLDMTETYWDFEKTTWVEVESKVKVTIDLVKETRNNMLKMSDIQYMNEKDPIKKDQWLIYRQNLRDFFDTLPSDVDLTKIVWPKTPIDIEELERKGTGE